MKTRLTIEIETPDQIALYEEGGNGELCPKEDAIEFSKNWHAALIEHIKNATDIDGTFIEDEFPLDEFYNEDGNVPPHTIGMVTEEVKEDES